MNDKIRITICTGTACFVMGGSDLLLLEEQLPESLKERVHITASTCIDVCQEDDQGKPPFVEIDGVVMSQASIPKIVKYLNELKTARN